jgi:hypothetical protein
MKTKQNHKQVTAFKLLIVSIFTVTTVTVFSSCQETPPASTGSQRVMPLSAYTVSSTDPSIVGTIHNAFLSYFFDSIGSVSSFKSLSLDSQSSRFYELICRFMLDSTNVDTTGYYNLIATYKTEQGYVVAGDYANMSWIQSRADSLTTNLSLAADEDSSTKALIDTIAYETDNSTRSTSLSNMQTQWQNKWLTIDGNGTNGNHDYFLGAMCSVGVHSSQLWNTGGPGGGGVPPVDIGHIIACDAAGAAAGWQAGSNILSKISGAISGAAICSGLAALGVI